MVPRLIPSASHVGITVLAFVALPSSVNFIPLVLLLAATLAHLANAVSSPATDGGIYVRTLASVLLGVFLARIGPSASAFSSPGISIITLLLGAFVTTLTSLFPITLFVLANPMLQNVTARSLLFPTIWATTLSIASYVSPIGRLGVWSPATGEGAFRWLLPYLGQPGQDWVLGVCAIIVVYVAEDALWIVPFLGMPDKERNMEQTADRNIRDHLPDQGSNRIVQANHERSHLIHHEHSDYRSLNPTTSLSASSWRRNSIPRPVVVLSVMLAVLSFPAILSTEASYSLPSPRLSDETTELKVACIMPPLPSENSPKDTFEAYRHETAAYGSRARVHLWPEGAVQFGNAADRKARIEQVRQLAASHLIWIGVGFKDLVPREQGSSQREGQLRNGLVLVGPKGVEFEYYKRNLVPITESFSMLPSNNAPPLHTIHIPYGKVTRPVVLSASICLDLAHPSIFHELKSQPDLILAPGNTWDARIGVEMLAQAAQRADEINARALWCDAGGVSGVVGQGESDVQRGRGSFVRSIGIPFFADHDDETAARQTLYGRGGDILALILIWGTSIAAICAERFWIHFQGSEGENLVDSVARGGRRRVIGFLELGRARIQQGFGFLTQRPGAVPEDV